MIFDIHSHILPGVDDGSTSMEDSIQLVRDQIEDGVTEMILTPHYRLGWFCEPADSIKKVYEKFLSAMEKAGLEMKTHLGCEVHDDPRILGELQSGRAATLAGTNYFLLEPDWRNHNLNMAKDIKEYVKAGYAPIVVHYERFPYKTIEEAEALKDAGALLQINAYSLLACEAEENRDFGLQLLDADMVDFIATDYHVGKFRKTKEAYALIGERYGEAKRDRLFYGKAKELFSED